MVNEAAPDGFSALHIAAANDNAEIASILLDEVNTPQPLYNTIVGVQDNFHVSYPIHVMTRVQYIDI